MNTDMLWRGGPPPHVGWWIASAVRRPGTWRWWNGRYWSSCVDDTQGAVHAAVAAVYRTFSSGIEWTHYWPENARVPRLDPTDGHWTFNDGVQRPTSRMRRVEVRLRGGTTMVGDGWMLGWDHLYGAGDIVAWRHTKKPYGAVLL